MSRSRFILLLAAALVAAALAFFLSSQRHLARDTQGTLLFPTLLDALNGVTAVTITKGAATPTVTIHRSGGAWTVAERADYPADVTKLRKLLLALGEARIVEEKTSLAANYAAIGVADPGAEDGAGTRVAITAPHETDALIVGKPSGSGNFVRPGGGARTYVVEPTLSFETEPRYWIDPALLDIPSTAIANLTVKIGGDEYRMHRAPTPAAIPPTPAPTGGFVLDTPVPKGRQALEAAGLAPPSSALANLTVEDVAPAASIAFGAGPTAVFTLNDGDTLTLGGAVSGDKRWITVAQAKNPSLAAKTAGRAFEIPNFRYDEIFRPLETLLVPKPEARPLPASKPAPRGARAPGSAPGPHGSPGKPPA